MMIANRLVVFLVILLTNYACQNLAPTVKEKKPNVTTRVVFLSGIIAVAYLFSGLSFYLLLQNRFVYGNQVVTNLVSAAIIALIAAGLCLLIVPAKKHFLTTDLKKTILVSVLLLTVATVTQFPYTDYLTNLFVAVSMYFLFSCALSGVHTRNQIAAIPPILKGLPLDIVTLFLFYLSFSFLNGVFFNYLF
ncbi:hypothetical protein [Enterococcus innesii]|uniref:Uncharacterized protein n=1 Tax=Enterococcus innesii TaxID=2839759 RepID=A0ABM7XN93_9ENTE|nr:hypothetical protein [Enterococcus innesii]BDG66473.1 hypothetical protein ENLAB_00370 [Enterococcus innesii]